MILTCTECDTSFNFDERLIKSSGSKVRCSKCHSVFVAYPTSGGAAEADQTAAASSAAAGLADLDLDEIEKSLDLDIDTAVEQPDEAESQSDDLDFDLGLEEDVVASPAATDTQFQKTQELDLSDFDLDEATDSDETPEAADDDISFDLDLDESESPAADQTEIPEDMQETEAVSSLDFDLDFDMETDESESGDVAEDVDASTDDLDFSLDLDLDQETPAADEALSDAELLDETRAMDVEELDDLLDMDEGSEGEVQSGQDADALDIDLDLENDSPAGTDTDEATEELEFDLDLDFDEGQAAGGDETPVLEETEELDLADLGDMVEVDEDSPAEVSEEPAEDEFELDLDLTDTDEPDSGKIGLTAEETEELDLSGLEDALELDESSGESAGDADADLDMEFDFDSESIETNAAGDPQEASQDDLDLGDLDDMLDMDEADDDAQEDVPVGSDDDDDFDLELEIDAEGDDVELVDDFVVEEKEGAMATAAAGMSGAGQQGMDSADAFDMGTVDGMDETVDQEHYLDDDEGDYAGGLAAKRTGGGIGRSIKMLLALFLVLGGAYGSIILLDFFGIQVPYIDVVKEIEIPYVSDLLGPKDPGNLNIAIVEKQLKGKFLENKKLGTLYVVKGRVKNNYTHKRSYINLTGKLYVKGGVLNQTKNVYAGSVLSDKKLAAVNKNLLAMREKNRNGDKRSNVNVPGGKSVPFMIVFANLPSNPDEYSVEVAGSVKAK